MPTEDDLRKLLSGAEAPNTLDAERIIAKSRMRRLPAQLAAGTIGVLALAGVGVVVVQTSQLGVPSAVTSAEDSAMVEGGASDSELSEIKRAPADLLNLCGAPVSDIVPSTSGLELAVAFPSTVAAGTTRVDGTVRLTNLSTERVTGTTAAVPALTLSRDGVTVWHTNGAMILSATIVDLAPGESLEYTASFEPVQCAPEDDGPDGFRANLPALAPGTYELSAAIDFAPDAADPNEPALADLVMGPRSVITID